MRAALVIAFASVVFAQSSETGPKFTLADIHPSAPNTISEMRARFSHGRYELRNATLVELIRTAWNVEADNVTGGPEFLDTRRFDVIAMAPAGTSSEALHMMLRALLRDRFRLTVHDGKKDGPALAIMAGKKPELQPTDGTGDAICNLRPGQRPTPRDGSPAEPVVFDCHNMTMAALAKALPGIREASGYVLSYPVLDQTNLSGAWDFSLKFSPRNIYMPTPAAGEPVTLFDAFEKQLGLRLAAVKVPMPVIVVDGVNERPTPNPPGTAEQASLRPEFEVAEIKPDRESAECSNIAIRRGAEIDIHMTLKGLIAEAWGDMNRHRIVGGPKSDGQCWAIAAKTSADREAAPGWVGPVWNGVDIDTMRLMLRSFLVDRFGLAAHDDESDVLGYALVAAKPKLNKADPANRPGCKEGPGADGKDPRIANPMASRLITCRDVTLKQFAAELSDVMYGALPVVDATGITGRYDMTISFSPPNVLQSGAAPDAATNVAGNVTASEPNGAISIFEALTKQLGLKLQSRNVKTEVLVIDRVNETPTEN